LNDQGEVVFCNKAAEDLFEQLGLDKIKLDHKAFTWQSDVSSN
jgi:hypothetical protein